MKRLISFFLAVTIIVSVLSGNVFAEEITSAENHASDTA
ncbi:hypothetical protein HMPREF1497_2204, partial [Fusobacterium sp. CM21]